MMDSHHAGPSVKPAAPRRFSARSLLPVGFCGVFLLMSAALVETYRMQVRMAASPAAMAMYDRGDLQIDRIRRVFNQTQILVHDFLLKYGSSDAYVANLRR